MLLKNEEPGTAENRFACGENQNNPVQQMQNTLFGIKNRTIFKFLTLAVLDIAFPGKWSL